MQNARSDLFVTAYEGKLWAVGGCENKSIETYDPKVDSWSYANISTNIIKGNIVGCSFQDIFSVQYQD